MVPPPISLTGGHCPTLSALLVVSEFAVFAPLGLVFALVAVLLVLVVLLVVVVAKMSFLLFFLFLTLFDLVLLVEVHVRILHFQLLLQFLLQICQWLFAIAEMIL